jgi:hypothetical protein
MYQASESLPPEEHGQTLSTNDVVALLEDGRKIRQVSDIKFEVTTYKGAPATNEQLAAQVERLRKNYTQMGPDFWATLIGELTNEKWPAARIADAVSHVLRVKPGGFLSIADIFSFDRPFKLYNYSGYLWLINSGRAQDAKTREQSDFATIDIDGKTFFYLKKDLPQNKTK